LLLVLALSPAARALPGFYVAKDAEKRVFHEAHVVLLMRDQTSVVTTMADYDGPLEQFALVLAVPGDVTLERVRTLKREFVDRVDQISAPRFHEWWELDPCEPGEAQQEWERSLKADPNSAFLGGGSFPSQQTAPPELFLNVKSDYKQGEYTFSIVKADESLASALRAKGYALPANAAQAIEPYAKAGMNFLIAEVDPKRVELIGSNRAQLSPIRYHSESLIESLPVRLGRLSASGMQELFVYVLHPDSRYEAKNYPNIFPPTNLEVDPAIKERIGEFYASLHDLLLKRNPEGVLNEFAWHSAGCGEPCPNAALQPAELLSLGGDVSEALLSKDVRDPKPPPLTAAEQAAEEAILAPLVTTREKALRMKQLVEERRIVLRNKGILDRQKYVISRLHHRYDAQTLPNDLVLTKAVPARGGVGIPAGQQHELSFEVTPASENRTQVRYNVFHPWQGQQKCASPKRFRWGKPPRTYRGLRKTWVVEDISRKSRTQINAAVMIKSPVPALGLNARIDLPGDGGVQVVEDASAPKAKSCGCDVPGKGHAGSWSWLVIGAFGAICARRARRT
jgi:hypothetical protein